ncbi:MAG: branched-chain amino acid ABC transporter permease [Deltaproteobacteria bacterium]|nr:branched-chain amino acid ABC transporter permease [Deltaproteobacteria bacterium]
MISTLIYGLTIGGILYIISIGLSLTFGSMRIVNFAHGMVYTTGAYILIAALPFLHNNFFAGVLVAIVVVIPLSFIIEKFIIRRLYGESIDYAIIATYAVLLIGVDLVKWIWGTSPIPLSDPVGKSVTFLSIEVPLYRLIIIAISLTLCVGLWLFFKKTIVGKIIIAGLQDREAVRSLGISVDKYFSLVFVLGSCLAALGGVLYAPITTVHPYMGFHILLISFAVVIVGGLGSLKGTTISAFVLGMVMAITGRFWGPAAEAMVFAVMAVVLIYKPIEV